MRDYLNGVSSSTVTVQNLSVATTTSTGYIDKPNAAAVSAYRTTAQTINNTSVVTCIFDTEAADRSASYDTATGIFTAPRTGLYRATAGLVLQNVTITNGIYSAAYISKNNLSSTGNIAPIAAAVPRGSTINASGNEFDLSGSSIFALASGDTLRVIVATGAGGNLSLRATSNFCVDYLG